MSNYNYCVLPACAAFCIRVKIAALRITNKGGCERTEAWAIQRCNARWIRTAQVLMRVAMKSSGRVESKVNVSRVHG